MTVIECLSAWFKEYSGLSGRLGVDYLSENADAYSIDTVPSEEVIKRYKSGVKKQYQFAISSRRFYDQDIQQNIDNLKFFEDLTAWVEQKAKARQLPAMDEGRTALKIVVTSNAYPFIVSEDGKARYQVQMRLEYYKEA